MHAAFRAIAVLGLVNLTTGLLLFFSCRCLPTSRLGRNWMKNKWYQRYFKFHCYIWYIFGASVITHGILALKYYGWPF